jgi:gliding motility-associated lipoprotein GldH
MHLTNQENKQEEKTKGLSLKFKKNKGMRGRFHVLAVFSLIILIGISCDKNRVYDHIVSLSSKGWTADKGVEFDMPVDDPRRAYDILLHLRNTGDYKYSNIWLFIETKSPGGNSLRDTFEIKLANESGRWIGKGIGNVYEVLVPYKQNILFPNRGIYQVTISQAMREQAIEHLLDVGLRLQYHNERF